MLHLGCGCMRLPEKRMDDVLRALDRFALLCCIDLGGAARALAFESARAMVHATSGLWLHASTRETNGWRVACSTQMAACVAVYSCTLSVYTRRYAYTSVPARVPALCTGVVFSAYRLR